MSEDAASFTIELMDRVTGPSASACNALDMLSASIKTDSSALGFLENSMKRLESSGSATTGQIGNLKSAIDAKKAAILDATKKVADMSTAENLAAQAATKLAAAQAKVAAASDKVSQSQSQSSSATKKLVGSTEELGGATEGASGSLGAYGAAAMAVAGVLVAVASATEMVIVKMAELSFQATELREAQLGLAMAETDSIEQANALVDAQYAVARSSSLTQQSVFDLSNALLRAGVPADQFKDTLRAMADVSAVAGDRALKSLQKIIANSEQLGHFQLKDTALKNSGIKMQEVLTNLSKNLGISVEKVKTEMKLGHIAVEDGLHAMNEALENKFAGPASRKMLNFGVQMTKLHENFLSLFDGVDASPFLGALQNVLTLFDSTTEHGKGMKKGITEVMNTVFRVGAQVVYGLEAVFLGLELGILKVYIAAHPLINRLKKALGMNDNGTSSAFDKISMAAEIVGAVVGMSLAMVTELIISLATLSSWSDKVTAAISAAFNKAVDLGAELINGLIAGIEAGAGRVSDAVSNVAKGAIDAGKSALGIASPSTVFRLEVGRQVGAGMALGINDSRGTVETSMRALAMPIAANDNARPSARQAPRVREQGGGGRGSSITIHAGAFTIHVKSTDPKAAAKEIRAELQKLLEEAAAVDGGENEEAA